MLKQFSNINWLYTHISYQNLNCLILQIIYAETDIVTSGKTSPEKFKIACAILNSFYSKEDFMLSQFNEVSGYLDHVKALNKAFTTIPILYIEIILNWPYPVLQKWLSLFRNSIFFSSVKSGWKKTLKWNKNTLLYMTYLWK